MFDLRSFVMRGIRNMVGKEPEYTVIQYSAGWFDKGVLTEEDLTEISTLLGAEETLEETPEEETEEVME